MSEQAGAALLSARNISKQFGEFRALSDVSLEVKAGEVHGLLGANGAGKSTLIGVLSGAIRPDSGTLSVAGRTIPLGSLSAARQAGLSVVHQELMLFNDRTVEENIFASALPSASFRFLNLRERRRKVEATLERIGAVVDLGRRIDELPLSHRQLVEIGRALCSGGRVLVLDEPTSALSQPEAEGLFSAIRSIVAEEAAVIFVSHRFDEVFSITNGITVLRDGRVAGSWRTADVDIPSVTRAMVGETADAPRSARRTGDAGRTVMTLLGSSERLGRIDLSLRAGEIVGLAGLEGSGVSTVMEMLGGVERVDGRIEVEGAPVTFRHPSHAIGHGVVYMPPDRKKSGLWLDRTTAFNINAASVSRMPAFRWLDRSRLEGKASARMRQVGVRISALREFTGRLSGGNQQRVLLGRCLDLRPRILLLSDFTRGVDVKAKAEIHQLVRELADEGIAICLTSSDMEELLDIADRIVCMQGGRVVADQPSPELDKHSLLTLASTASPHPLHA
ncbi:ribose import ATP-binding protein RbsA [Kaistia sp. 32K]|uniref:sugar ABC transporter ATP-binding protein n=1 Tax=Kaistia sp. 32K TaxID=2795690 RepID=UPI0019169714|nr:sugar ABC transporter ATP-binding protein [Kaistia sp. 32K]BCP55486.1 ribose import ATP-binding protein RbsA [Kaistia sp. 32K]